MREIIVTVDKNGDTQIETRGFVGSECLAATADLEKALGAKSSDRKTREYSQTSANVATARQGR